jgi:MoxR-like ATPase
VEASTPGPRYWAITPGEGGRLWNECQEKGIIVIGWDFLGDLSEYPTQEAIADKLRSIREPGGPEPHMDSLACLQFARTMSPGDYVVAKIGRDKLLGIGVVQSDYRYDRSRTEYRHNRRVRWRPAKNLVLPEGDRVAAKTLTEITNYKRIVDFVRKNLLLTEALDTNVPSDEGEPYTIDDAMAEIFFPRDQLEAILSALRRKKNVILQGPPGVGKSFVARRLAYGLMGHRDKNRVSMVQFHQAYSYENFIQGYRPGKKGFSRHDGTFYEFCNRARLDLSRPFIFIIDEINRGNLSKIFGELMLLIEHDKRGPAHTIPLTYSESTGEQFSVPENVHLIGLMNTADRSLAMVDYALRRRFAFFDLEPQFGSAAFRAALKAHGAPLPLIDRIVERMTELNETIGKDDKNLGHGFEVGHSYFCPADGTATPSDWQVWYRSVVEYEIAPLLREYWFDDVPRARREIGKLLA